MNNITLTEEQYNRLAKEDLNWFIKTAYRSQFVTGMTTPQAEELFGIYNEVFGAKKKVTGCGQCKLEVATALGRLWFTMEAERKITEKTTKKKNEGKKNTARKSV